MAMDLVAFLQSVDPAGAFVQLTPVADQHVTVLSPFITVPAGLNNVAWVSGGFEAAVAPRGRLVSPSLLLLDRLEVTPFNTATAAAVLPLDPPNLLDLSYEPLPLVAGEQISFDLLSNPAAPQIQWALIGLSDGPVKPVTGKVYSVRATSAVAAVGSAWTNVPIAFADQLPVGRYQVVGFQGYSTTMIAARIFFQGQANRPGVVGAVTPAARSYVGFRFGAMGVFGEFESTNQPTVDVLCAAADATQFFTFDLIQVRAGAGGP